MAALCTDGYALPQTCGPVLYAYPQQIHPTPPPGGPGGGGHPWRPKHVDLNTRYDPDGRRPTDDEEIALLIAAGAI